MGVRRVSTGSLLAARAYGALVEAATVLRDEGIPPPSSGLVSRDALGSAFD